MKNFRETLSSHWRSIVIVALILAVLVIGMQSVEMLLGKISELDRQLAEMRGQLTQMSPELVILREETREYNTITSYDSLLTAFIDGGLIIPDHFGWFEVVNGTGSTAQKIYRVGTHTGKMPSSDALLFAPLSGLNPDEGNRTRMDWGKKILLSFIFDVCFGDYNQIAYVQLKDMETPVHGDLAQKGIGIKIENRALKGVSYGKTRGEIDLNYTLTQKQAVRVSIVLTPGTSIKWYINGDLKGIQVTPNKIPYGIASIGTRLCLSIGNGISAANRQANLMRPLLWLEN